MIILKMHNCFVYFIQTIDPWRMVFYFVFYCYGYWVIMDLILLFFNIVAPPKQACSQRRKTYCLYNQGIESTKWQIKVIIQKREEDF